MNNNNISTNKAALHDYEVLSKFQVGIVLSGSEVKSCRNHSVVLKGSYAMIIKGELYLLGCNIPEYENSRGYFAHNPNRQKKLLAHKREILKLSHQIKEKGVSLIPLNMYFANNKIKLDLAICKGKHNYDKRETLKKKQIEMDLRKKGNY